MRALPIVPLDQMPASTLGMSTIRGTATPVVDVGALLGNSRSAPGRFVTEVAGILTTVPRQEPQSRPPAVRRRSVVPQCA